MVLYKIQRWDPVVIENNNIPLPMIYIQPDEKFIEFAKQNNNLVLVRIDNTGLAYDGKAMVATVNSSAFFPSPRPHFYEKNKFYTLTLDSTWLGYPMMNNGTVEITGLTGRYAIPKEIQDEVMSLPFRSPVPVIEGYNKNISLLSIITICIGVALLIVLLLLFIRK